MEIYSWNTYFWVCIIAFINIFFFLTTFLFGNYRVHTYMIAPINSTPLSLSFSHTHTHTQTNKRFAPSYYERIIVLCEVTEPLEEEINLQQSQFKWHCLGSWDYRSAKTNVAAAWRRLFASRTVWRAMYPKLVHVVTPGQLLLRLSQAVDSRQLDKVANSGASKYGSVNHQIWLPLSPPLSFLM